MSDEKEKFEVEDFGLGDDFGAGISAPVPDAEDFKIPRAADAARPERTKDHREKQAKASINAWKARDRREGVPPPAKAARVPPVAKRDAIQIILLKQQTESTEIKKALEQFVAVTIAELGGWEFMSAGQKGMVLCQRITMLVILACEEQIVSDNSKGEGLMGDNGKPHPLFSILRDYLTAFRQGQVSLGLGLRSRMPRADNQTIATVMQEYAKRKSEKPLLVPDRKGGKGKAG